ncbi:MAG: serine/threonine-protein kinase, partial [Chloroflexota bacterium]
MSPINETQEMHPEGETVAMPEVTTEDETRLTSPINEDGATIAMPEAVGDDGETIAMPEATDDGQTIAKPPLDDPGTIKAIPPDTKKKKQETKKQGITETVISDISTNRTLQDRYRLDKVLGKGGFGAAYLATDIKLSRACVVKQMLTPRNASAEDISIYRANFEREAKLLVELNEPGHPNIPEIYDFFSDAGSNYLVMKFINGQDLKTVVDDREQKLPWRESIRYVIDVCSAINYMHNHGDEPKMHRDIKPANILLGDDGRVWLVDFGLAKATPVESTGDLNVTQAAGSIGYTPFEQWLGEAVTTSDVYALGATLHHLLTGVPPSKAFGGNFSASKLKEMHGKFDSILEIDSALPKELEGVIKRATAEKPEDRLAADRLQKELEALTSGTQAAALYTFKSGEAAKTVPELVQLCQKYRKEAQGYLYQGDFERWFLLLNRNDLADAATQAVKQGKNQNDGLERFFKIILPNLWLKRLTWTGQRLSRAAIWLIIAGMIVTTLIIAGGVFGARAFLQQSIGNFPWQFDTLNLEEDNRLTEKSLEDGVASVADLYVDDVNVDMQPPDQIQVDATWNDIDFDVPLTVRLEENKLRVYLSTINGIQIPWVLDMVSQGLNAGIDDAFQEAPVDITELTMSESEVAFRVAPSGR